MSLQNAVVTLSLKQADLHISAFPQKLLFGEIDDNCGIFKTNKHFIIPFYQFHCWYLAFTEIIDIISGESKKTQNIIVQFNDNTLYFWKFLESKNICFGIEVNNECKYQTHFNLIEFNDLIWLLKQLIFKTLPLKPHQEMLFHSASLLNTAELLGLKEDFACKKFIEKTFQDSERFLCLDILSCQILIQYYLEIIVLHHKINSLYNTEENISDKIIEMITM